jgi:hypothetical protein
MGRGVVSAVTSVRLYLSCIPFYVICLYTMLNGRLNRLSGTVDDFKFSYVCIYS